MPIWTFAALPVVPSVIALIRPVRGIVIFSQVRISRALLACAIVFLLLFTMSGMRGTKRIVCVLRASHS
jgi:hypothetical protein